MVLNVALILVNTGWYALGIGAMAVHFFKNGQPKRFLPDYFGQKTFGGEAGVAQSPARPGGQTSFVQLFPGYWREKSFWATPGNPKTIHFLQ